MVLVVALLMGGCGGSSSAPAQTTTPNGSPGSVSAAAGSAVPLGIGLAKLEARLGTPAMSGRRRPGGFNCVLYRIAEQPPFVKLQYCFRRGRLKYLSTYAVGGDAGAR